MNKNDVHVYVARTNWDEKTTQQHLKSLPHTEQAYSQRYTHPLRLRSFVASRHLLRHTLSHLEGKPVHEWLFHHEQKRLCLNQQQTDWHASLSHGDDWVACVLAKTAHCGVDIESTTMNPRFMAIAQRFFHPLEHQQLVDLPEHLRFTVFLEFWTKKEACVKAWHCGLAHHLAAVSFQHSSLAPVSYPNEFADLPLKFATYQHFDWQLACAVHLQEPQWLFDEWGL
jgi:4'-phosphopantetheinyl transferase